MFNLGLSTDDSLQAHAKYSSYALPVKQMTFGCQAQIDVSGFMFRPPPARGLCVLAAGACATDGPASARPGTEGGG